MLQEMDKSSTGYLHKYKGTMNTKLTHLLREAQKDKSETIVVKTDPNQIRFNSYETKNFHICPKAQTLFKGLADQENKEVLGHITRAVKDTDKFFALEIKIMELINTAQKEYSDAALRKASKGIMDFVNAAFKLTFQLGFIQTTVGRDISSNASFVQDHVNEIISQMSL
jgi:hypothetical protein